MMCKHVECHHFKVCMEWYSLGNENYINDDCGGCEHYSTADFQTPSQMRLSEDEVNCVLTMFGKCSYNETGCSDCEIKDKIRKALNARPQGEWIEKVERRGCFAGDKTVYSYTCPFCGAKEFKKYPFCHCGADMRVKDELGGRE